MSVLNDLRLTELSILRKELQFLQAAHADEPDACRAEWLRTQVKIKKLDIRIICDELLPVNTSNL